MVTQINGKDTRIAFNINDLQSVTLNEPYNAILLKFSYNGEPIGINMGSKQAALQQYEKIVALFEIHHVTDNDIDERGYGDEDED